ncbi:NAD-dependent protein deacetylase sirtuin-2-like [Lineus longissimus]|uniref:NAD-dependent protein deacetylase sirtuin-2-like n=1 Tax=Lineus longissimus TaxID=88925 RepID=UPI002B4D3709
MAESSGSSEDTSRMVPRGKVSFNETVQERPISSRGERFENAVEEKKKTENKLEAPTVGDNGRSPKSMYLLRSLANSLGFDNLYTPPEKHLETVDMAGVVKYIKDGGCKNIVCMCGAGISTSAGIPDYRSPGTGMLDIMKPEVAKFGLPDAKAVYTYEFFKDNPEPYYYFASQRFPSTERAKPTAAHYFIRLMGEKGLLLRNFTQNIDNLERLAGQSPEKLVQVHGNYHNCYCQKCYEEYTWNWCLEAVKKDKIPKCVQNGCDGIIRPDIVMFGENLPFPFFDKASEDCPACDLLIILGTSLAVAPFNRLVSNVPETTPRLMINKEKEGTGDAFFALMGFGSGLQFDSKDNYRDVFMQGSCDDGCYSLADALGWGEELRELIKTEHARVDAFAAEKAAAKHRPKSEAAPSDQRPKLKGPSPQSGDTKAASSTGSKKESSCLTKDKTPTKSPLPAKTQQRRNSTSRVGGGYKASTASSAPRRNSTQATPKK